MNTDHVQCYTCEVSCNFCGLAPTLDAMSAVALIDVVRGFLLMHRRCEKPVEPSKQVELFDALAAKEAGRASDMLRELRLDDGMETEDECSARTVREEMREAIALGAELAQGIDGMTDEPDPETDPPGPQEHDKSELLDQHDAFGRAHPMARDHLRLRMDLEVALQGPGPTKEQLETLPVGSVDFDTIAQWCRIRLAEMNRKEHPEFDPWLPSTPQPMPRVLRALLKPKRGTRPFSQPKKRRSGANAE